MSGAPRSRRRSLLPIPQRASYCYGDERYFPRQSSHGSTVSLHHSSSSSSWSSILTRPIPPTPRRMMSPHRHQGPNTHRRRYSGIPRPSSGSSRLATPLVPSTPKPDSLHTGSNSQSTAPQAPSAWRPPQSHVGGSFLPYSQSQHHFSGSSKQGQSHQYNTQSPSAPGGIKASFPVPPTSPRNGARLAKSPPVGSLLSTRRDIRPQQSLMKPLSPPLPKTHITTNSTCFGPAITPQSSSETYLPWSAKASAPADRRINAVDALFESRMTEAEIRLLNKEFSPRQQRRMSSTTTVAAASASIGRNGLRTPNLPLSDAANALRLERQQHTRRSLPPALIHTSIASTSHMKPSLATSKMINRIPSPGSGDDWDFNLRLVHFAEPAPYWAGRYMTITGRLRQEEMNGPEATPPCSSGCHECVPKVSDDQRMKTALKELRSCCRTSLALQSFESFETSLKRGMSIPSSPQNAVAEAPAELDTQPALSSPVESITSNTCSVIATPTKIEHSFPNIWSRLALPKSKTTGNLLASQPEAPLNLSPPMSSLVRPGEWMSPHHDRRLSRHLVSESKNDFLKDVREFVKTPVKIIHQRFSATPRTPSYSSDVSTKADIRKLSNSRTMPQLGPSTVTNSTTQRMRHETAKTPPTVVKLLDEDTLLKNRRRSARKSNGELVKGVLDASLKQVKLMGKLVGEGVSWMGSQEDLDINVIAARAR